MVRVMKDAPWVRMLVTPAADRYKTPESTAEPNVETDLCAERPQSQPPGDPRAGDLWPGHPGGRARRLRAPRGRPVSHDRVPPDEPRRGVDRLGPGSPRRSQRPGD